MFMLMQHAACTRIYVSHALTHSKAQSIIVGCDNEDDKKKCDKIFGVVHKLRHSKQF